MRLSLARQPLQRNGSVSIVAVSLMHIYQMYLLAHWPATVNATSILALQIIEKLIYSHDGLRYIILAVWLSAIAALIGTLCKIERGRLFIFLPQHLFLGIMAFGGLWAMWKGHYLDGTKIPWPHISADQVAYIVLFAIHSYAIIRRCHDPDG